MRKIISILLSMIMAVMLAFSLPPLPAAAAGEMELLYRVTDEGRVALSLTGIDAKRIIYGVQMEVTVNGAYQSNQIALVPESGFSASSSVKVNGSGDKTSVTLYLVSAYALNRESTLALGELMGNGKGLIPQNARVSLLDADMIQNGPGTGSAVNLTEVPIQKDPNSSILGDVYKISASQVAHGVYSVPSTARENQRVEVQVTPDEGYKLESLKAVKPDGTAVALENLGDGRYAFTMPGADVTMQVVFASTAVSLPFTDVEKGKWYYSYIQYAYEHELMTGTSATLFDPNGHTSRAMIVTILYRLEGEPDQGTNDFIDVAADRWYTKAISWASANEIVNGYGNGRFGPNDKITREQMAAILYRYAKYKKIDTSAQGDLTQFNDRSSISKYATEAITWATGTGLLAGKGQGTLAPKGFATRAETATIFTRFCEDIA